MKKLLILLLLAFVATAAGCGDDNWKVPTPDPKPEPEPEPEPEPSDQKIYVSTVAEFGALTSLVGGDTVVWKKGNYRDVVLTIGASGTATKPLVVMGEVGGEVVFTGATRIVITGSYVVLSDFWLKDPIWTTKSMHPLQLDRGTVGCTLKGCKITGTNTPQAATTDYKWISIFGKNHLVEGCSFEDKRNIGTLLVVWMEDGIVAKHTIRNNYFSRPVSLKDGGGKELNGQETIRIGTSDFSLKAADCIVEGNWFDRCDGEIEAISSKSCGNIYRNNLFTNSTGMLTLRHGNDCTVTKNYFLSENNLASGGVRVIGERHTVTHNYMENLRSSSGYRTGICLVRGYSAPALSDYAQVKECVVAYNTFVNCYRAIHSNYGSDSKQIAPVITSRIENNIVITDNASDYTVCNYATPTPDIKWTNNTIYGGRQSGVSLATVAEKPIVASVTKECEAIKSTAGVDWK